MGRRLLLVVAVLLCITGVLSSSSCSAGIEEGRALNQLSTVQYGGVAEGSTCNLLTEPCAPCSDIWGITVTDRRFAILSLTNGWQFVDVTDPRNPVKGAWIKGCLNEWRDMKVYGNVIYAISEDTSTCACPKGMACMEHLDVVSGPPGSSLPDQMVITQSPRVPPLTQWPQGVQAPVAAVDNWAAGACQEVNMDLTGKIALVPLHSTPMCMIDVKAKNCLDKGAIGIIVVNKVDNFISPGMSGTSTVDLPIVLVQKSDGLALKAASEQGEVVVKLSPENRAVSPYYEEPEGLTVVDFSNPDDPQVQHIRDDFSSAHNVFVEETRPYLYVVGMTRLLNFSKSEFVANGGFLIYDLSEDSLKPKLIGSFDGWYVHDLFVHQCNDRFILVAAHINDHTVSIIDVTDPANYVVLRNWTDRYSTAHNIVMDETCQYAYLTHELPYAPVSVWKFDLDKDGNPDYTSEAGPHNVGTLSVNQFQGSMAHNVWRDKNMLWASYYETGSVVWDITDPSQPKLVAVHLKTDASAPSSIWGMYPYTGVENVVYTSDINNGLEVLELQKVEIPTNSRINSSTIGLLVLFLLSLAAAVGLAVYLILLKRKLKRSTYQTL